MEYLDFRLLLTTHRQIRTYSEAGEQIDELQLDMNAIHLSIELVELGATNAQLLQNLGGTLYDALLPARIHGHWRATVAMAEQMEAGVRLRLEIEPPELAIIPWELLYDRETNSFLANSPQTAISRYIPVPLSRRDVRDARPPLQILLVTSSPTDLPAVNSAWEEQLIRESLQDLVTAGQVEIDVLSNATLRDINRQLRVKAYNVFHFYGHGQFKNERGRIALVKADGTANMIEDERFSNLFLGNRHLGLILLNTCHGAATSDQRTFIGMAPHLVRRGIPAVIAMRAAILDETAKILAAEFYHALSIGWPVDMAMQSTRNAIALETGLDRGDFVLPVLYMRARDGIILTGLSTS